MDTEGMDAPHTEDQATEAEDVIAAETTVPDTDMVATVATEVQAAVDTGDQAAVVTIIEDQAAAATVATTTITMIIIDSK